MIRHVSGGRRATTALALALSLSGCSTFTVKNGKGECLEGVPFYRVVGVLEQTTVRTRTWTEVTLAVKAEGSQKGLELVYDVPHGIWDLLSGNLGSDASAVMRSLEKARIPGEHLRAAGRLEDLPAGSRPYIVEDVASNVTVAKAEPRYGERLYFNVRSPLFGTSSGTIKLSAQGTLTEAVGAVDSSKLADVLPIKEFLSAKLLDTGDSEEMKSMSDGSAAAKLAVSIESRTKGYRFELTRRVPEYVEQRRFDAITFACADSVVRGVLGADASGKKKSTPLLDISASVTQPKKD